MKDNKANLAREECIYENIGRCRLQQLRKIQLCGCFQGNKYMMWVWSQCRKMCDIYDLGIGKTRLRQAGVAIREMKRFMDVGIVENENGILRTREESQINTD